jgi:hypothetical protein
MHYVVSIKKPLIVAGLPMGLPDLNRYRRYLCPTFLGILRFIPTLGLVEIRLFGGGTSPETYASEDLRLAREP